MKNSKSVAEVETIGPSSGPVSSRHGEVDLADVVAFVRVVEAGSFTRASAKARTPKSALSRRVARLEQTLGTRLLQRTTRSLSLTDAGSTYFERASNALTALNEARDLASETTLDPTGVVRVTAPVDIAAGPLSRALADFAKKHPLIHVEVEATPRVVDLVAEGFDLAIRAGKLRDSSLVARKIGESPSVLVASPRYFQDHARPKKLSDLERHACVLFRSTKGEATWTLTGPRGEESVDVRGPLSGTDFSFVRAAAVEGVGIAFIPIPACLEDIAEGRLEQVLPKYVGPRGPVHVVFPSARFIPQRVAVLRDFLVANLNVSCPEKCERREVRSDA